MLSSKLLQSLLASPRIISCASLNIPQCRSINIYNRDIKKDYKILKDLPIGPHKVLPPGQKLDGRIGPWKNYRRIIHYPEKYTVKKLDITKLGGRDPVTGRKVINGVGGGAKQKARWIVSHRVPLDYPKDKKYVEKIINICYDPLGPAKIAITASGNDLRWIYATTTMKIGDVIESSKEIPTIPIKPIPGNGYVVGALPIGTEICNFEMLPGEGCKYNVNKEKSAVIMRKYDNKVVIKNYRNLEFAIDQNCQCVAGSIAIHPLKAMPMGSPNRKRWLGIPPRSGLWKRKDGTKGKKIKALPPVQVVKPREVEDNILILHCNTEGTRGSARGKKRPFKQEDW